MKKIILTTMICGLFIGIKSFANEPTRSTSAVDSTQEAAEQIVKTLYGKPGDTTKISKNPKLKNSYIITITNGSDSGSVSYIATFKTFKLNGSKENEVVSDLQIKYGGGN